LLAVGSSVHGVGVQKPDSDGGSMVAFSNATIVAAVGLASLSRRLVDPAGVQPLGDASGEAPSEFTPESLKPNPCSHDIDTPYYIGDLRNAKVDCTTQCPKTTYPNNEEACQPCDVVGCATCSRTTCNDCLIFHLKFGQQCLFLYFALFAAILLFVVCFCLCGLIRFCFLTLLSPRSPQVLKEALAHRRRAKVHDYSAPGNPFFPFDDTSLRTQNITGIGVQLYFRFVAFMTLLSFLVLLLLTGGYFMSSFVPGKLNTMAVRIHAVALYSLFFIAVWVWMCSQDNRARGDVEENTHLRNYALVAEGFPRSAKSPHEVKAFFESILGFEIEGVSIAYDHVEEEEFIEDRIARTIEKADTHLGVYPSELAQLDSNIADSQDSYMIDCLMNSGYAFIVFSREEDREFCSRRFEEIDRQVKQGFPRNEGDESDDESGDETTRLLSVGDGGARKLRSGFGGGGPSRAVLFRGKFPIRVGQAPEPSSIQWRNFAVRKSAKALRVTITLLVALLLVTMIGAVVFAPAVLYMMSFMDGQRTSQLQWQMFALEQAVVSASIAIGNCLLMAALRRAATESGFLQKVNEDAVFAVCSFCTIILNSTAPLIVAAIVANSEDMKATRELRSIYLFQVLWMSMVVTEAANIILPSWSYLNAYFWIRQSEYASVREAEPIMTAADFPFAYRYVSMLHALFLICVMIASDSKSLYTIAGQCLMLVYSVYVYFVDKYCFLRVCRPTYYMSPKMDGTVHYLFVFHIAVLSFVPLQQFQYALPPTLPQWVLTLSYPRINVIIFVLNALVFFLIAWISQKCNTPERQLSDLPYIDVAMFNPQNFFNTNPVHVLRTLHFPSIVVPPIYPHKPGKEYLNGGQFADYDDSVRLRETLMLLVKTPLM
jgi:hypothetical protein